MRFANLWQSGSLKHAPETARHVEVVARSSRHANTCRSMLVMHSVSAKWMLLSRAVHVYTCCTMQCKVVRVVQLASCTAPKKRFGSDSHEAVSTSHSRTEREDRNPVSAPFQVHPEKTASRSCRSPKLDVAFGSKNNGLL